VVRRNCEVVDLALAHLHEVPVPKEVSATNSRPPLVSALAPDFVQKVSAVMMAGKGDLLPVSAFPVDGTWPVGTAKWEKRNLALEIPVWDSKVCIQCNQCALVCPHAAIRAKVYEDSTLADAPSTFKSTAYRGAEYKGKMFTIQVAPEDCTGCNLCVNVCPAKDRTNPKHKAINMEPQAPLRDAERSNYDFFLNLPELDRADVVRLDHKGSQFLEPLFEYSGACSDRIAKGEAPLNLDYGPPKAKVADYMRNESRFRMIERADPARFKSFLEESQAAAERRYLVYQQLAGMKVPAFEPKDGNGNVDGEENK
jgi:pyruvate-ferredoxin/flavodoxin oxidoreductase